LTDWYERNLAVDHEHRWELNGCEARMTIWGRCVESSTRLSNGDYVKFVNTLVRLREVQLDQKLYKKVTNDVAAYRSAARDAAGSFDNSWNAEQMRVWWLECEMFLNSPSSWREGFDSFRRRR